MRTLKVRGRIGLDVWDPFAVGERHLGKDAENNPIDAIVADHPDTRKAIKRGSLLAADEATARLCGVAWTSPAEAPATKKKGV